ncbi:MAG: hypothetical protein A2W25_14050 [candidate division Zixibacteria bacterium RBG_16_53_22]|nr:MAG: hypothetical protein A2W25_14050 [candidate division Zixibacteria bacterium RBG_16_53_22]
MSKLDERQIRVGALEGVITIIRIFLYTKKLRRQPSYGQGKTKHHILKCQRIIPKFEVNSIIYCYYTAHLYTDFEIIAEIYLHLRKPLIERIVRYEKSQGIGFRGMSKPTRM